MSRFLTLDNAQIALTSKCAIASDFWGREWCFSGDSNVNLIKISFSFLSVFCNKFQNTALGQHLGAISAKKLHGASWWNISCLYLFLCVGPGKGDHKNFCLPQRTRRSEANLCTAENWFHGFSWDSERSAAYMEECTCAEESSNSWQVVTCRFCAKAGNNISDILSLSHHENLGQDLVLITVDSEKPVHTAEDKLDRFAEDAMQPSASATTNWRLPGLRYHTLLWTSFKYGRVDLASSRSGKYFVAKACFEKIRMRRPRRLLNSSCECT